MIKIGAIKMSTNPFNLKEAVANVEKNLLSAAMEANRYNQSEVSRITGLSRGALPYKLKAYFGDKYIGGK